MDTLAGQRSDHEALEGQGHALLATLLPKGWGKRGHRVAIALGALPSHGTMDAAHHDQVCRSTATGGTPSFCPDAPAYAVGRGCCAPLARCRVRARQPMDHVVSTLLERLVTLGICMKLLLLDRDFYSVRVIQDLITAELPFIMPVVKRGKNP